MSRGFFDSANASLSIVSPELKVWHISKKDISYKIIRACPTNGRIGDRRIIQGGAAMPRIARMIVKGEDMVYHIISRTALDGYVMGDIEKEYLLKLIKRLSSVYFSEILGLCLMCFWDDLK